MGLNYFEGKDNFIWARGVVEDRFDPLYLGRCKVRYFGWHPEDKKLVPTDSLPWSHPMISLDPGRAQTVGPKEGDWIVAFFLDGEAAQFPVMMGIVPGIPEKEADPSKGFNDPRPDSILIGHQVPREPDKLEQHDDGSGNDITEISPKSRFPDKRFLKEADTTRYERGWEDGEIQKTIVPLKIKNISIGQKNVPCGWHQPGTGSDQFSAPYFFTEPETPYNAKYPYNHAYFSEGGHLVEIDDTPNFERLHWYHRSGSFKEIHPIGLVVEKIVDNEYHIVLESRYTHIEANDFETVDWGKKVLVNKDNKSGCHYDITVGEGSNFNVQTNKGEVNFYVNGDVNIYSTGNVTVKCDQNLNAVVGANANLEVTGNLTADVKQVAHVHVEKDLITTVDGNVFTEVKGNVVEKIHGSHIQNVAGVISDSAKTITRSALAISDSAEVDHTISSYSLNQTSTESQINAETHTLRCSESSHIEAKNIYRVSSASIEDMAVDSISQQADSVMTMGTSAVSRQTGSGGVIGDFGDTLNIGVLNYNARIAVSSVTVNGVYIPADSEDNHTGTYSIECDTFKSHGTGGSGLSSDSGVEIKSQGTVLVEAGGDVQLTAIGGRVYAGDNALDDG